MKSKSIRQDLFTFLKNPNFDKFQDLTIKTKLIILFKIFILTYIGLIIATLPFQILKGLNIISETTFKLDVIVDTLNARNIGYKPYFIISTIILVPIFEEMAFRLFLTKFKINYFIISISVLLGYLVMYFIGGILWRPKSYLLYSVSTYLYIFIISGSIGATLWFLRKNTIRIEEFWNKSFGLIFYSLAILFALVHSMSISFNKSNLIFAPIILLPFLVYGLSFGYIRIRLGIIYSIILHFITLGIKLGLPELINALKANRVGG